MRNILATFWQNANAFAKVFAVERSGAANI
jgi:hypothetical protein